MSKHRIRFIRQRIRRQIEWLVYYKARNKRTVLDKQDVIVDRFTNVPFCFKRSYRSRLKSGYFLWRLSKDLSTFCNEPMESVINRILPSKNLLGELDKFGIMVARPKILAQAAQAERMGK